MTDENKEVATTPEADTKETAAGTETQGTTPGGESTTGEASTALSGTDAGTQTDAKDTKGADASAATESKEEWREKIIKHDEKYVNKEDPKGAQKSVERINRFPSVEALWDSYRELEKKLSSGSYKKDMPENASPEQLASWRKDNGVPEKFEDYDLKFEDGLVISDLDKPKVDKILQVMHTKNVPTGTAKEVIAAYFKEQQEDVKKLIAFQEQAANDCALELQKEWGPARFTRIVNTVNSEGKIVKGEIARYFDNDELFDKINNAILPNGKPLGSDKDVLRFFAAEAFNKNPYSSVSNGSGMATGHSVDAEIKEIEELMSNHNSKYWKGPESAAIQERYRELTIVALATKK